MKYLKWILFAVVISVLLSGCTSSPEITGVWEEEIQVDILGTGQDQKEAAAVTCFTFREDGSGTWETDLLDGSHPSAVQEFTYTIENDTLVLHYGEDSENMIFSVAFEDDQLVLDSQRGSFHLNRVQ